jgi:hypothetical protein
VHPDFEADERKHPIGRRRKRRAVQQRLDDAMLAVLPRQTGRDVNWMDRMCSGLLRGQHRAVEPARQQDE